MSGTSAHGQGHATSFAMIVADRLGIPIDRITYVQSDTAVVPHRRRHRRLALAAARRQRGRRPRPRGARAGAAARGRAARGGRRRRRARATTGSAVAGVPGRPASTGPTLAARTPPSAATPLRARRPTSTAGAARRSRSAPTSPSSRSTPRPARSRRCATSPSTTAAGSSTRCSSTGQQHGGIAAGHRQALWEEFLYDDDGNPLTSTLADYPMPTAADTISFEAAQHRDADAAQPARRQGHRRVRHDRLDPGGAERRGRRAAPPRRAPHRHAVHPRARSGGPSSTPGPARLPDPWREPPAVFDTLEVRRGEADGGVEV